MSVYFSIDEVRDLLPDDHPFTGRPWVLDDGPVPADVHLIKATPSYADFKSKRAFMGDDGLLIRRMLFELGLTGHFSNAIPFIPVNNKVKVKEADKYKELLNETIRRVGCPNIAIFGADAAKMMAEYGIEFKKFNEVQYRTIDTGEFRFRIFPHPAVISRSPTMYTDVKRGFYQFAIGDPEDVPTLDIEENYTVHTTRASAEQLFRNMPDVVACDTETTGLDVYSDKILTVQFSWVEGEGHSVLWELFSPDEWAQLMAGRKYIFHNAPFDVKVLASHGVNISIHEDTMLMHSLIDETGGHAMDLIAPRYLGADKWSDRVNYDAMEDNDMEVLGEYGARDTDITLRLANLFRPKVEARYIHTVLNRAQNAIVKSELRGIKVNRELAFQFQNELESAIHDRRIYMEDVYGLVNPNSPAQVAKLLYEDMGLPKQKLGGSVTTRSEAILALGDVPAVRDILEYRHLVKANGTYVSNILRESERDGRYHPDIRLAATETGRAAEKLIMLIPRPDNADVDSLGKKYQYRLRELFIPDEGMVMIGADYSGLEVSMVADLSKDSQLIRDVRNQVDTHSVVAIQAFDLPVPLEPYNTLKDRVSAKYRYERNLAKAGTFAWLYGGDANTVARNLSITVEVAEKIFDALMSRYVGVANWHQFTKDHAAEHEYVSTPWGRRRHFTFNSTFSRKVTEEQFREAINAPVQGMASDMNLAAFATAYEQGLHTLFPFHDATYIQAWEDNADEDARLLKDIMESALKGSVPFRVDVKAGSNWGALG